MIITQEQQLLRSGSKSMVVDGTSAKVFSYSPSSGVVHVTALSVVLADNAASDWTKFGAVTGLTNGVLVEAVIGGNAYTITTLKDNSDLNRFFNHNHHGSSLISALGVILGVGGSQLTFVGHVELCNHIVLTDSDMVRVTIQDDLTALTAFNMSAITIKDI